jgi:hypothetical protein
MDNNEVDEEKVYEYLDFGHEDEDCTISSDTRKKLLYSSYLSKRSQGNFT